jgi:hypothetical protein
VDPEVICNGGRTGVDFATHGTGDRLIFQTGATPDSLVVMPLTQVSSSCLFPPRIVTAKSIEYHVVATSYIRQRGGDVYVFF